ncbi:protein CASC3 [Agrilus planipennis]|uniref:Protein CASC3 n=1 Tax=Agrilus planipennis TaxID=224129 RepID=A0A1W4XMM4_AGRPL|nr:protein CASC3 [Agrilus planipennis]
MSTENVNLEELEDKGNLVDETPDSEVKETEECENDNNSKTSCSNCTSVDSDDGVEFEREEGDGQEGTPFDRVDDDEDKKNPQYIPKKGTFYEHDDRTVEAEEPENNTEKGEKVGRKTMWIDKKDHWSHDKYNDTEQAPKSKSELIAVYGYDIRNEDGPPKARRRRRYGRGPSKYTRNWEDEDAYKLSRPEKKTPKKPSHRKKQLSDFVPINKNASEQELKILNSTEATEISILSKEETKVNPNLSNNNTFLKSSEKTISKKQFNQNKNNHQQISERDYSSGQGSQKKIEDSDYKGFTRSRQYRSVKSEQKILPKTVDRQVVRSQSFSNRSASDDVEASANLLSRMNINDGGNSNSKNIKSNRQINKPPRLQSEQKGSKRYSSLRQRSLPETSSSPNFYPNEFTHQRSQQASAVVLSHTNSVPIEHVTPAPLQPISQQISVPNPPLLQTQSHYVTPFPPGPPPFLQSSVAQQTFIPAQPSAALINYVPGQPQFSHPQTGPFEGFQAQQFNAVTQQPELCQYQGGTTYYSTQNQHVPQRSATTRRPKAAIPIIPPPQDSRGRGRSVNVNQKSLISSSLEDTPKATDETVEHYENVSDELKE